MCAHPKPKGALWSDPLYNDKIDPFGIVCFHSSKLKKVGTFSLWSSALSSKYFHWWETFICKHQWKKIVRSDLRSSGFNSIYAGKDGLLNAKRSPLWLERSFAFVRFTQSRPPSVSCFRFHPSAVISRLPSYRKSVRSEIVRPPSKFNVI